uniref:Uncharacterized protein n=1 Tax=Anopheles atroparvus TaxID=41427 RepID=A0A182IJ95_ANOAO
MMSFLTASVAQLIAGGTGAAHGEDRANLGLNFTRPYTGYSDPAKETSITIVTINFIINFSRGKDNFDQLGASFRGHNDENTVTHRRLPACRRENPPPQEENTEGPAAYQLTIHREYETPPGKHFLPMPAPCAHSEFIFVSTSNGWGARGGLNNKVSNSMRLLRLTSLFSFARNPRTSNEPMDYVSLGCCSLAFVLYINTLNAGFVYDDSAATALPVLRFDKVTFLSPLHCFLLICTTEAPVTSTTIGNHR